LLRASYDIAGGAAARVCKSLLVQEVDRLLPYI